MLLLERYQPRVKSTKILSADRIKLCAWLGLGFLRIAMRNAEYT